MPDEGLPGELGLDAKLEPSCSKPSLESTTSPDKVRFVREVVRWYRLRFAPLVEVESEDWGDRSSHNIHCTLQAIARPFFQACGASDFCAFATIPAETETNGLQTILQHYQFLPDEEQAAPSGLTPAVLGTVFEQLLAISPGTTETLRKQTGTFFTPTEIVNSMVTVGVQSLLKEQDSQKIVEAIAQLKICDPACGAGAFPVALLHHLTQLLAHHDPENDIWRKVQYQNSTQETESKQRSAAIATHHTLFTQFPADFSRRYFLLKHCLWGMDIQPVAVMVTQLRCQLALLATLKRADNTLENFASLPTPLPPLHFAVGDSLLNSIAAETTFPETRFDLVITNPPHLDSETMSRSQPERRSLYHQHFATARGNWDLFVVFFERGLQLLRSGGILAYIVPNKLVGAPYARTLRELLRQHRVLEMRDYASVRVFRDAHVYPVVAVLQKSVSQTAVQMTVMQDLTTVAVSHPIPAALFYRDSEWDRYFVSEPILNLLTKCANFPPLREMVLQVTGAATVGEAYALKALIQEADDVLPANRLTYKKLLNTGTIDPYRNCWGEQPMRYLGDRYRRPLISDEALRQFSPGRFRQAAAHKLILAGMAKRLECVYDAGECLAGKSTVIIWDASPDALKYLLALLNSSLITVWFRAYFRSLRLANGYFRISKQAIQSLPIPTASDLSQRTMLHCVDQLLQSDRLTSVQISALKQEIDACVCQLYGVKQEEVAIATLELC